METAQRSAVAQAVAIKAMDYIKDDVISKKRDLKQQKKIIEEGSKEILAIMPRPEE